MTRERDMIGLLKRVATHPAAAALDDDAAHYGGLVLTHDTIVEGVHFLASDPPSSVGWKLVAVNLSDLAGKGAEPAVALLSLTLAGDDSWDRAFLDGVEAACEGYGLALVGGDTVALPQGAPRVLGLTAIGRACASTPLRSGGMPGDRLWVVGTLGDSAAGLSMLLDDPMACGPLVDIFRRPIPLLAAGRAVAPMANAMMDISDGLLLDAERLARASGCAARIDIDRLPLSEAFRARMGDDQGVRMFAATGGDDYALLAALPPDADPLTLSLPDGPTMVPVGTLAAAGPPLSLTSGESPVTLPERLGYEHRSTVGPAMDDRL